MKPRNVILAVLAVVTAVAVFLANRSGERAAPESTTPAAPQQRGAGSTQPAASPTPSAEAPGATEEVTEQNIPHFHASLEEAGPLPRILPASNFRIPVVARAYRIAARIPEVLAQQPCYCWCDKIGHGSLVDCFATDHGAGWAVCVKEVLLADQLTRAGLTPAEIRQAIIRGEWKNVRLAGVDE